MWCSSIAGIYAQLRDQSAMGICVLCLLCKAIAVFDSFSFMSSRVICA